MAGRAVAPAVGAAADGGPAPATVAVTAPPGAEPSPPTDIALVGGGSWRANGDALEGFETLLGVDLQRAARERGAGAALTLGVPPLAHGRWASGHARPRRIPIRPRT